MRTLLRTRHAAIAAIALSASLASSPALGSTASEERQGAALTKAVNTKARSCTSLSATEFERIGEYAMGLNFTSSVRHDAMDRRMSLMMGAQGEQQSHQAIGRAYSGCAASGRTNQSNQSGFGMMGTNGSSGAGTMSGMMGGSAYGPGMVGGDARGLGDRVVQAAPAEQGISTLTALLLAVVAAGVGAVLFALIAPRLKGRRPTVRTT